MSPEPDRFTESAIHRLGTSITDSKKGDFSDSAQRFDYQTAARIADFLGNPQFMKDLMAAATRASEEVNSVLREYGVDKLDIEFPFEVFEAPEVGQLPAATEQDVLRKENDATLPSSTRAMYAAIARSDDGRSFRYKKEEVPFVVLEGDDFNDEEMRRKAYQNWQFGKKDLVEKIRRWSNGRRNPTVHQFVTETIDGLKRQSQKDLYAAIDASYSLGTEDFIAFVLERKNDKD